MADEVAKGWRWYLQHAQQVLLDDLAMSQKQEGTACYDGYVDPDEAAADMCSMRTEAFRYMEEEQGLRITILKKRV